jgi:hypothetical protein
MVPLDVQSVAAGQGFKGPIQLVRGAIQGSVFQREGA